jgi:hypothetical protein
VQKHNRFGYGNITDILMVKIGKIISWKLLGKFII